MTAIKRARWFDRKFPHGIPVEELPGLIERLRGTGLRLRERVGGLESGALTRRDGDAWSINENVGHLGDVEPLWLGRIDDLMAGLSEMRPADLTNRKTHEASHNERAVADLVETFARQRQELVGRLEACGAADAARAAHHARLGHPLSVVDLAFFVAEHDDAHLAEISRLHRVD